MNTLPIIDKEVMNNDLYHAYLFVAGDETLLEGVLERFIFKTGCLKADISTIDQANDQSLNKSSEITALSVRKFIHELSLSPHGKLRIGIIRQAEKLNRSSANILLKTLEEPSQNVIIILTASTLDIIETIQSRCRIVKFNSRVQSSSNTFSYKDFATKPFYKFSKEIEKIVKENQVQVFLADLTDEADSDLGKKNSIVFAKTLEKIIEARKKIKANANPRLVLENLILNMKAEYER